MSSEDHGLESLEIIKSCSSCFDGDLLGGGGFSPFLLESEIFDCFFEVSVSRVSHDWEFELGQSDSFNWDELSLNSEARAINQDLNERLEKGFRNRLVTLLSLRTSMMTASFPLAGPKLMWQTLPISTNLV